MREPVARLPLALLLLAATLLAPSLGLGQLACSDEGSSDRAASPGGDSASISDTGSGRRPTPLDTREITRGGTTHRLVGAPLRVGTAAPVVALKTSPSEAQTISDFPGEIKLVLTVPSLDTDTCALVVETFEARVSELGDRVGVVVVSRDLPMAQERFRAASSVRTIRAASDYIDGSFGRAWGLYVDGIDLLARAVYVLDGAGVVRYVEVVREMGNEPDYDAAMAAVNDALARPASAPVGSDNGAS